MQFFCAHCQKNKWATHVPLLFSLYCIQREKLFEGENQFYILLFIGLAILY